MKINRATSIYIITPDRLTLLLKKHNPLLCYTCNKPIILKQKVLVNHHHNTNVRHLSCAKKIGMI